MIVLQSSASPVLNQDFPTTHHGLKPGLKDTSNE